MRRVCSLVIFLCLLAVPVAADQRDTATVSDLEALKAQVAAQQEQIRQLQELLQRQAAALEALEQKLQPDASASGSVSDVPPMVAQKVPLEERVEHLERAVAKNYEKSESLLNRLGSFSLSGNLRVRYEPFFQDGFPQRHRERARLRLQLAARINEELRGGLRLATGNLSDPITTNQTFTGFFTRKTVGFDRFWLTYDPTWAPWLSVTTGKFAYPWYRTELTFDSDLNPEGFAETLSFDFADSPLTNLTLVGFQLPFNELSRAGDSFVWGGQVQTHWRVSDRLRLGLYAAGLNFRNADAIVRAVDTGALDPSLPLTNTLRFDAAGDPIGFAERFAYLDLIAEVNYRLRPRWPMRITLDFVNNVRAGSSERSGYWGEIAVGRTAEQGDWLFGYTLMRVEKDAVIAAYKFSDTRAATNIVNHRLRAGYRIHRNVILDYTLLVGRLFNPQENIELIPAAFRPQAEDPFLSRMQFDVIYEF